MQMCGDIMFVDLSKIINESIGRVELNSSIIIPDEYLEKSEIIKLKDLKMIGLLEKIEDQINIKGVLEGIMVLEDSISLEPTDYPFKAEIDEEMDSFLEKSSNILDITEILWQNIVLEVPLKLTNVSNFDEYHGDGWKLISEDSIENTNNPFKELKDMLGKEWYYGSTIQKSIKN